MYRVKVCARAAGERCPLFEWADRFGSVRIGSDRFGSQVYLVDEATTRKKK